MRDSAGARPAGAGLWRPAGLFVIDDRQRIVEWSDGAGGLTGVGADRAVGRPCHEVVRGRDPSGEAVCRHGCPAVEAVLVGRLSGRCDLLVDAASEADGKPFPLQCELMALPWQPGGAVGRLGERADEPAAGRGRTAASRDVIRDLSALAVMATALSTAPLERSLGPALACVRAATGAESAELFLADPDRREMLLAAYGGPFWRAFCETPTFGVGEGYPGLVLERRAPVVTRTLDRDARFLRAQVRERGFRSYVCVPLVGPSGVIGALGVASRRGDLDADGVLRVLAWAGALVGAALDAHLLRMREALIAEALEGDDGDAGIERLLRRTLGQAMEFAEADGGGLLLVDPAAGGPVQFVTAGAFPGAGCAGVRPGAEPACPVLVSRRGLALSGPRRTWPLPCRRTSSARVAGSCLPMRVGGEVRGLIQLAYHRRGPMPPTRDAGLLLGMADAAARVVGMAIARAERRRRLAPSVQVGTAAPDRAAPAPDLTLRCLGPFELRSRGLLVTPDAFRRRKALTLLKILLVHAGRPVPRDTLVELLWPGTDPDAGLARLHVVVHTLRRVIEPAASGRRCVVVRCDGDRYAYAPEVPCRLDLDEFRAGVAIGRAADERGDAEAAARGYEEAVLAYRGDLFEGETAEEWFGLEREHLRETFLTVLAKLASLHVRAGDLDRGIERYRLALRVDPLREEVHRRLIESLWHAGRRDEALRQYRVCRDLLAHELGVAPLPETVRLAERVRSGPPS